MRASALAALGLAAYSVFLVATIPATFVAAQVASAALGRIEASDAQGTLWHGSARARVLPARGGMTFDRVEWRFMPARLASGEIAFAVKLAGSGLAGSLEAGRGVSQWRLRDVKLEADASALAAWLPLIATWRPSGRVTLEAAALAVEGREVRGAADVEWRGAGTTLSEVRPLGSYRATWRAESGPGKLAVTTLQGPLRVTGQGTTTPALRVAFSGEARGEGESAKALEPLLDLMGPRRPDGARALELRLD